MRASAGEQLPVRMVEMLLMGAEVTDFKENITIIIFYILPTTAFLCFFLLFPISYFFGSGCPVKADINWC